MKHLMKLIPSVPKTPSMPTPPNAGDSEGAGAPMGGGMPAMIQKIMSGMSGGSAGMDIQKMMKDFDLDQYRDENGKVVCPASQEQREAFLNSAK